MTSAAKRTWVILHLIQCDELIREYIKKSPAFEGDKILASALGEAMSQLETVIKSALDE